MVHPKILKHHVENGVHVYKLGKIMTDEEIASKKGQHFDVKDFPIILQENADVYGEDGELLLRLRKNVLPLRNIEEGYNAIIDFAHRKTGLRGIGSGSKVRVVGQNNEVMSNVVGYFDTYSLVDKHFNKIYGIKSKTSCRVTAFTRDYPEKWKKFVPLVKDIDRVYKKLVPKEYKKQRAAADQADFVIKGTAFSTITTNVNFQTALHTDRGDYEEGFGNLVAIRKGKYKGGYTGFPQYGAAVDLDTGDFLAMDVHQYHCNTPIIPLEPGAIRLSLVSYLRHNIATKYKDDKIEDYYKYYKLLEMKRKMMKKSNEKERLKVSKH